MRPNPPASQFCFAPALALLLAALGQARVSGGIVVEGISDKQVANGSVRIRVNKTGSTPAKYWLDGQRIPAGTWFDVSRPGFHELNSVEQRPGPEGEQFHLVRFVIQSARGQAEWALPPWTPLPPVASGQALNANAAGTVRLELFMPTSFPAGLPVPMVAMMMDSQNRRVNFNGQLEGEHSIAMKRGVGSGLLDQVEAKKLVFKAGPLSADKTITIGNAKWQAVQGTVTKSTTWKEGSRIHVTSNLTVAKGATLIIKQGCVIKLAPKTEVTVLGKLIVEGTKEAPVVFCPETPDAPWGGITLKGSAASAEASWAFVTGSGGNSWWFVANNVPGTHRNEQAAFFLGEGAKGAFADCFFIDNAGQAFHGESAQLTLDRCVVQRCQTVGQFNGGSVTIRDSALLDFPSDSATYEDGDNDALYFTLGEHEISGTLIGWCKDDGIDAGGNSPGTVTVSGCWIESCFHEGLALSGTDKIVRVLDSVIINCGQAVEVGYLSPNVTLERCLLTGNGVGARFGDNYGGGHLGFLSMTSTLSIFNQRDVWGMSRDLWAEKISRMKIVRNYLSKPHESFPDNWVWEPTAHSGLLSPFLSESPFVPGIGFRGWDRLVAPSRISVGLSRPSTRPVQARFKVRVMNKNGEAGKVVADGILVFQAGETAKNVSLKIPDLAGADAFKVELLEAVNGELSGLKSVLFQAQETGTFQTWIAAKSGQWKWLKGIKEASEPRNEWQKQGFSDAPWTTGTAPFGYGREGVQTALNDMRNNYTTVYLRHEIELDSPDSMGSLQFHATYDDGFAIWINGFELARVGLPAGELPFNGRASESDFAPREWSAVIPAAKIPSLATGKNIVAVHLFNTRPGSTDLFFDLSLTSSQSTDADSDKLPDEWEQRVVRAKPGDAVSNIGDVLPSDDFDGDGLANRWELAAGTDPVNPFSAIRLKAERGRDGTPQLQWQAKPHRVYQLQGKRRLAADTPWETLQQFQPVFAPTGENRVTPLDHFQSRSGFFRLRLVGDQ